jgi:hypothetical protein
MPVEPANIRKQFERGVVILSFDTEQIWGHMDLMSDSRFERRYPDAIGAHSKLLACLAKAGISATWFLVGGLTLRGSQGSKDSRMTGLPDHWKARIPAGREDTAPLWYRRSFVEGLRKAYPLQEIGLHGGLTHFIWTRPQATREVVEWELAEGMRALEQASVRPIAFSFGREQECHYDLLPVHGIRCYRGRTVAPAYRLGPTLYGKMARLLDEMRRATPMPVWPEETLAGLWNIPASLFLYPTHFSRTSIAGLKSRIERFRKGVEAAARCRGIFHFCLHPENLAESRQGFAMFEEIIEILVSICHKGDIEALTMGQVTLRMEAAKNRQMPELAHPNDMHVCEKSALVK